MTTPTKLFQPATLTTAAVTYYTVPSNTSCIIKKLTSTNSTGSAQTVSVYLVPSGGANGATNIIESVKAVGPNATVEFFEAENHVLSPGDFIVALCSANGSCNFMGSGIQVV